VTAGAVLTRRRRARAGSARTGSAPRGRSLAARLVRVLNRLVPANRDRWVLVGAPDVEDGLVAVAAEVVARGLSVTLLAVGDDVPPGHFPPQVRVLRRDRAAAVWAFVRAGVVVTTHGAYDHAPAGWRQTLVYVWHGESLGKRTECFLGLPAKPDSVAPALSDLGAVVRAAEFGLPPARVPVLGAPRNDRMLRAAARPASPWRAGLTDARTVLLWMPTFRSGRAGWRERVDGVCGDAGLPFGADELHRLDRLLAAHDVTLLVKLHPVAAASYDLDTRRIVPVTDAELLAQGLTVYTALPLVDGLVTDVSSIWVDHLLLDRPIVFAFPDLEEYRAGRGFVLEPYDAWLPGPVTRTVDELADAVGELAAGRDPHAGARRGARRRLHRWVDDGATTRLVDLVLDTPRRRGGRTPSR
jgi:CDP-glycerol glycerophosphotransferase